MSWLWFATVPWVKALLPGVTRLPTQTMLLSKGIHQNVNPFASICILWCPQVGIWMIPAKTQQVRWKSEIFSLTFFLFIFTQLKTALAVWREQRWLSTRARQKTSSGNAVQKLFRQDTMNKHRIQNLKFPWCLHTFWWAVSYHIPCIM